MLEGDEGVEGDEGIPGVEGDEGIERLEGETVDAKRARRRKPKSREDTDRDLLHRCTP
jgi:hypothetical protein